MTDATGKPVAGAVVEAFSIETEVTRKGTTNDKGQYRIIIEDGGRRSTASASRRSARIRRSTTSRGRATTIASSSTSSSARQRGEAAGPGRHRRSPAQRRSDGQPADGRRVVAVDFGRPGACACRSTPSDLAALAALAPGVILTTGTDSTAATFSVAGQSAASNTYVVNGQTTTSSTVPQDAVRSTRVITNSYDVARGNFSGGMVSVTTKGGGNRVSGSLSSELQNQTLAWGGNTGNAFGAGDTQREFRRRLRRPAQART